MPSPTRSGIITLLTDFGLRDHFAGVLKGVIASIAPRSKVIDITHDVDSYQIGQARFLLGQSWPYFRKGSVHLCVVDPGVGSARRPILVQAAGHFFIGPDNGLLTELIVRPEARSRAITNTKLFLKNISQTFHGRDVFAPVAAHVAAGLPPAKVGPLIRDAFRATCGEPVRTGRRFWSAEVVHIDKYGNLITNLRASEFLPLAEKGLLVRVGLVEVAHLVQSYSECPAEEAALIVGSSGNLEIALNQASAAKALGVGLGAPVDLEVW